MTDLAGLAWGTLMMRPYVFVFLGAFLALAGRELGARRALAFLGWGWLVALVAELASTRVGVPFGLYHYTGDTAGRELFIANVPFFDSISFPFLAYASWCLARASRPGLGPAGQAALAGTLMMALDLVIDPLAVRGDRWFLGRIFHYPDGGIYFGVPVSNFAGWVLVGAVIVGGVLLVSPGAARSALPWPGAGLYYGVLLFNLGVTAWIGEWALAAAGSCIHIAIFLVLLTGLPGRAPQAARAARGARRPAADTGGSDQA